MTETHQKEVLKSPEEKQKERLFKIGTTPCFKGQYLETYGIVYMSFQQTPNNEERFRIFLQWLRELLFYNDITTYVNAQTQRKETTLLVDLNTADLKFAWKYSKRLRKFLEQEQKNATQHHTHHTRTCLVSSYSPVFKVLVNAVTGTQPYSRITWHSTVSEALETIMKEQELSQ